MAQKVHWLLVVVYALYAISKVEIVLIRKGKGCEYSTQLRGTHDAGISTISDIEDGRF